MALLKVEDFYVPTIKALRALGGSASIEEIQDWLTEAEGLTQAELDQVYPTSGANILPDRMSWARSYLKIAGLLASGGRGIWVLTDEGRQVVETMNDEDLRRKVMDAGNAHNLKLATQKKEKKAAAMAGSTPGAPPGSGLIHQQSAEAEEAEWMDGLLQVLRRRRIVGRIERMRENDRRDKLAAGWSETEDGHWVPPGYGRIEAPQP